MHAYTYVRLNCFAVLVKLKCYWEPAAFQLKKKNQ